MLIDSHAHLSTRNYDADRDEVLARGRENGLVRMIEIGAVRSFEGNDRARLMAEIHADVYFSVGLHPHDAKDFDPARFAKLVEVARTHPKAVGIGETGLDYYYDHSPRDEQQDAFRRQIAAARELNLPLIIHDRDAHDDCMRILEEEGGFEGPGEFHCFTGDWAMAKDVIANGWYIALGGIVTFKNAQITQDVAREAPLESLLLETDSPYLTPIPFRGKRNEPWYVSYVAERIAELKGIDAATVIRQTGENAVRLFGLGLGEPEAGPKKP